MTTEKVITFDCATCCDAGTPCSILECRSRGGEAELCGFAEFGDPSTPPRFYLEKELGGSVVICDFHSPLGKGPCYDGDCDNPVGKFASISGLWDCTLPEPDAALSATLKCIGVAPDSPGFVQLNFEMSGTYSGPPGHGVSYLGSINSVVFIGGFSEPTTPVYASSVKANNTALGMAAAISVGGCSGALLTGGSPSPECKGADCTSGTELITWCIPESTSTRYKYSGSQKYDPAIDCDALASDGFKLASIDQPYGCIPDDFGGSEAPVSTAFDPALSAFVETDPLSGKTLRQQRPNGVCSGDKKATECDRYEELKSEDTDEDALARLLAGPGGTFSAWTPTGDGTGGTCLNPPCCEALWEIRIDRTFEYREAEFRGTINGLTPGQEVDMTIRVYRKSFTAPFGTPYTLFMDLEYDDVPADMDGNAIVTGVVPNAEGFRTFVRCVRREEPEPPTP